VSTHRVYSELRAVIDKPSFVFAGYLVLRNGPAGNKGKKKAENHCPANFVIGKQATQSAVTQRTVWENGKSQITGQAGQLDGNIFVRIAIVFQESRYPVICRGLINFEVTDSFIEIRSYYLHVKQLQ